jgi:hypothetical protein
MDFKEMAERNRILEIRVGSHLFGTDTEDSDLDLFGIFMPGDEILYGFQECKEVDLGEVAKDDTGRNTADAIDRKLHEYRKFVRLAIQNNPNILHVLFVNEPNIVFMDERGFGKRLLEKGHMFPHKGAYRRFVKYADSQRHKMKIKPENYAALERGLDQLGDFRDNEVIADVLANDKFRDEVGRTRPIANFVDFGKGKHVQCGDLQFERGVFVKKAKRMIKERLSKATNRHVLYTKHGYDVKFASNLIHLLLEGVELMKTGWIQYPFEYRQDILDIKSGHFSVQEIDKWADELVKEARDAYENTSLPENPKSKEIEEFLIQEVKKWSLLE